MLLPPDADLVSRDPGMPGLAPLLDVDAFAAITTREDEAVSLVELADAVSWLCPHLAERVDTQRGRVASELVEPLREALLEGYCNSMDGNMRARVDVYTVVGLLRLLPEPFRSREPDWPRHMEALLARAETILGTAAPVLSVANWEVT